MENRNRLEKLGGEYASSDGEKEGEEDTQVNGYLDIPNIYNKYLLQI